MCRLQFTECGPECIKHNGCKGNCCDAPSRPTGCLITIHPSEQAKIEARGGVVSNGLLLPKPGKRGCPFKSEGMCQLHGTDDKPFGCIASPFTLNSAGTLIVRNRYKMLPCYKGNGPKGAAYKVFRSSLDLIFGVSGADQICRRLDSGSGDFKMPMPATTYALLRENDQIKKRGA